MNIDLSKEDTWVLISFYLFAIAIPSSLFLMSISSILLLLSWIYFSVKTKTLSTRLQHFYTNKISVSIASPFFLYGFGLIYTSNIQEGLSLMKNKLPLLIIPLVLSHVNILKDQKIYNRILLLFILSTLTVSVINLFSYYLSHNQQDIRSMSLFYSHIRFGICIVLSVLFIMDRYLHGSKSNKNEVLFLILSTLWFIFYLIQSESYTGLILLLIGLVLYTSISSRLALLYKSMLLVICVLASGYILFIYLNEYQFYKYKENISQINSAIKTINGNDYSNQFDNFQVENGHYIWRNICELELKKEWEKRSIIEYFQRNGTNTFNNATLIRYLSSKGLNKDSLGLSKLSDLEIKEIEAGITNYRFSTLNKIEKRIYETLWEIDYYKQGMPPIHGSLVQRFAFWENGIRTIQSNNMLFGVGTGDLQDKLDAQYKQSSLKEYPKFWKKPHNQFLCIAIQFGFFGLLVFLVGILYPVFRGGFYLLHSVFIVLILFSMLTEDSLDTQAGLSIYAFFQSVFSFGTKHKRPSKP